jgi:hypothetical protein
MQSNTSIDNHHRQLLVYCHVTNSRGDCSERFVDHGEFGLWRFLMEQRHGLVISDAMPCVWVPQAQCRRHDNLFSHAAFHVPVNRMTFEKFDAVSGVTDTQIRWVALADADEVLPVLERHLVDTAAAVVVERQAGEAISTSPAKRKFTSRPTAAYFAA